MGRGRVSRAAWRTSPTTPTTSNGIIDTPTDLDDLADHIACELSWPKRLDRRGTEDRTSRLTSDISGIEPAAKEKRDAHRPKVVAADDADVSDRRLAIGRRRAIARVHRRRGVGPGQRYRGDDRSGFHTGEQRNPFAKLVEKRQAQGVGRVTRLGKSESHRQHALPSEARVDGRVREKRPPEQSGAREKHDGHRQLRSHETGPKAKARHPARVTSERPANVNRSCLEQRHEPEHDRRQCAQHHREPERAGVDGNVIEPRDRDRRVVLEQEHADECESDAKHGRESGSSSHFRVEDGVRSSCSMLRGPVRIATSRRRAIPRPSMRFAILTHASTSTIATAANSIISVGRAAPTICCASGTTLTPQPVLDAGWSRSSRVAIGGHLGLRLRVAKNPSRRARQREDSDLVAHAIRPSPAAASRNPGRRRSSSPSPRARSETSSA